MFCRQKSLQPHEGRLAHTSRETTVMILGANDAHQQRQDCSGEVKGLTGETAATPPRSVFLYFTNNDWEVDVDSWMIQFHNPLEIRNEHFNLI